MTPQALATLAYKPDDDLLTRLMEGVGGIVKENKFNAQALANIIWAMGKMGLSTKDIDWMVEFDECLVAQAADMSAQGLATSVW